MTPNEQFLRLAIGLKSSSMTTATNDKTMVQHVDSPATGVGDITSAPAAAPHSEIEMTERGALPAVYKGAGVDAETAKYLDSSIVIDEETNRRIKKMLDRRILPLMCFAYFCALCHGSVVIADLSQASYGTRALSLSQGGSLSVASRPSLTSAVSLGSRPTPISWATSTPCSARSSMSATSSASSPSTESSSASPSPSSSDHSSSSGYVARAVRPGSSADVQGSIVCLHAACNSFSGLMAVRFFLGFFEAGVQPCLMTLTIVSHRI